jgi:PAS domain-containing protein
MPDFTIQALSESTFGFPTGSSQFLQQLKELFHHWEGQRYSDVNSQLPELLKQAAIWNYILQKQPCITGIMNMRTSQYLYVSNQIEAITGYSVASFMQEGPAFMFRIVHPDDVANVMKAVEISWIYWMNLPD